MNLRGPEFRRVFERQRGVFVAEGQRVVERLLRSSWTVCSVLVAAERAARILPRLPPTDAPIYVASQPVIDRMTGFNLHRGLLAAAQRPPQGHWSDVVDRARRLLIVERINDQENLGTLFRSAAALGMDALLLSPDSCDPLYRRTVRVSMGAVLDLPFRIVDTWPNVLSDLGAAGWHVVAFTPATTAISLPECQSSLHGYERVAVMVGSEGDGLSAAALALATQHVRIPMTSHTDSLNVAMAASIGMYAVGGTGQ